MLDQQKTYTKKVDIWSIGCILYELSTERRAFWGDEEAIEYRRSRSSCQLQLSSFNEFGNQRLTRLLKSLLEADESRRPSSEAAFDTFSDIKTQRCFSMQLQKGKALTARNEAEIGTLRKDIQKLGEFIIRTQLLAEKEKLRNVELNAETEELRKCFDELEVDRAALKKQLYIQQKTSTKLKARTFCAMS
jgi:serine/threonine protein kinase